MTMLMPLLIGSALALAVSTCATWIGFDRDRAFYPTVVVVNTSYYVLFSVLSGAPSTTTVEISTATIFLAAASLGFRYNLWLVVTALAAHAIFDVFHGSIISNPGVPSWWPAFCLAYDLTAAGFLAFTLIRTPGLSKPRVATAP